MNANTTTAPAIGDKITVTGTVRVAKYMAPMSYNRSSTMFIIIDGSDGVTYKISGSSESLFSVNRRDTVEVTAKVKGFSTWQDQDQTVLSHAKATVLVKHEDGE
jgi:hypothetical protein